MCNLAISNQTGQRQLEADTGDFKANTTENGRFDHDFSRIPVYAPTAILTATKEISNPFNPELQGALNALQVYTGTRTPLPAASRPFTNFGCIPINSLNDVSQKYADLWNADGAKIDLKQNWQEPGQGPSPAPTGISGPAVAFRHTFNILHAAASVNGSFR